ncbi:MAG: hypothetical protein OXI18_05055 [bacterium]|nr:hypothetical protein [bacterium]
MRYVTFNQTLLAVGLIGLVLALSHCGVVVRIWEAYSGSESSGWTHAEVALQAIALAIPLATLALALRRWSRGEPGSMSPCQLLVATGLLGLTLVSVQAPGTPVLVSLLAEFPDDGPSAAGPVVAQAVAFAIPLVVLATASLRHADRDANRDETVPLHWLLMCIALLGLMLAAAAAPRAAYNVAIGNAFHVTLTPSYASGLAVMVVGGLLLLPVVALWSNRTRVWLAGTGSSWLLAVTGLLLAGGAVAGGGSVFLLLVGLVGIPGLFWANSTIRGQRGEASPSNALGPTLTAVGLMGVALTTIALLGMALIVASGLWSSGSTLPAFVMIGIAGLLSLAVLALGLHRLREGTAARDLLIPAARARRVRFVSFDQGLKGVGLLGFTVSLALAPGAIDLFHRVAETPGPGPSILIPVVLLLAALALPLVIALAGRGSTDDPAGARDESDLPAGLSFSGLVTLVGLFGLVIVAASSPMRAVVIAVAIWEGDEPWVAALGLQAGALIVPLAIIMAARVRAWRVGRSLDDMVDAITLPRLVICFALLGPAIVASGLPGLPDLFRSVEDPLLPQFSTPLALAQLAAGAATLVAGLLVVLGEESRLVRVLRNGPPAVTAVILALAVGAIVSSYFGATSWSWNSLSLAWFGPAIVLYGALPSVAVGGLAVVALLWLRSDEDASPGAVSVIAAWRRAGVPVLGLAVVLPVIPLLATVMVDDSATGIAVLAVAFLVLACVVNVWPLVQAMYQLRHEPLERTPDSVPQTSA